MDRITHTLQGCLFFPKFTYKFRGIPVKITTKIFVEPHKLIPKFKVPKKENKKPAKCYPKIRVIKSVVLAQGYTSDRWNKRESQKQVCARTMIMLAAHG